MIIFNLLYKDEKNIYTISGDRMDKQDIRRHYKNVRADLTKGQRDHMSKMALEKLIQTEEYKKAQHIFAFVSMGDEIDTIGAIEYFLADGKSVYVPLTKKGHDRMKFSSLTSLDHLVEGNFGVKEPKEAYINWVDHDLVDLILVPGLAFDKEGYRTGYGGGFYDKFFADTKSDFVKIGYCFSVQLFEGSLPRNEFDVPVDFIITD